LRTRIARRHPLHRFFIRKAGVYLIAALFVLPLAAAQEEDQQAKLVGIWAGRLQQSAQTPYTYDYEFGISPGDDGGLKGIVRLASTTNPKFKGGKYSTDIILFPLAGEVGFSSITGDFDPQHMPSCMTNGRLKFEADGSLSGFLSVSVPQCMGNQIRLIKQASVTCPVQSSSSNPASNTFKGATAHAAGRGKEESNPPTNRDVPKQCIPESCRSQLKFPDEGIACPLHATLVCVAEAPPIGGTKFPSDGSGCVAYQPDGSVAPAVSLCCEHVGPDVERRDAEAVGNTVLTLS
jgi:hypothetical protein